MAMQSLEVHVKEIKLTNSFFSIKNEDNKLLHIISKIKKKNLDVVIM